MNSLGDRLLLALAPPLGAALIYLLKLSMRTEYLGEEHPRAWWRQDKGVIFSCWHDQLLMTPALYRGPGAKLLISSSKDGELIARTVKFFRQGVVRGSSTRGGRGAFRTLVNAAKEPVDLAITPDGPRGPRHELKQGVVQLARLTARPVIPLAVVCSRGHRFASWDRFLLPFPFCRGVLAYGEPLFYAAGEAEESFRRRLQQAMEENELKARNHLESSGVSAV
ncbi:MAG: lysophospholipid acyltransferase family protein [Desulfuromonadales bacterium]